MVADWPAEGIRETYTELDAGEIRSAAARAIVVWRDLPHAEPVDSQFATDMVSSPAVAVYP